MTRVERKFNELEDDSYDYIIDENGDFAIDDSFDTDLLHSLFVDTRADSSEIPQPRNRRGWFGDEFTTLQDYNLGSKLWLLEQARSTIKTKNDAVAYVKKCLQWLIDEKKALRVEVTGERLNPSGLKIFITIFVNENKILKFTYKLWKNSNFNKKSSQSQSSIVSTPTVPVSLAYLNGDLIAYLNGDIMETL